MTNFLTMHGLPHIPIDLNGQNTFASMISKGSIVLIIAVVIVVAVAIIYAKKKKKK